MADLADLEALHGVRMPWNVWPSSKAEATKCVVPLTAIVTPLHAAPALTVLPYGPLRCKSCRSLLNPFCRPAELFPQCATVEYTLPGELGLPPVFLFVLDTCIIEEELRYLKTSLTQAITLLPENAMVSLITFGAQVHVHELGFAECSKSYVFRGAKEVTREQILQNLELTNRAAAGSGVVQRRGAVAGIGDGITKTSVNKFLLPASSCEFTLSSLLDELQRDAWPTASDQRAARCTGTTLSVATGLLGACVPGTGARIMVFVGGPCTEGAGTIVSKDLSDPIRSHKNIDKDVVLHYRKAIKFYEGLVKQLVNQGHVLDLFASALDQSLKRVFESGEHALDLSFNGIFEVNCSKEVKIQGGIGPCASFERKGISCADTVIGQGDTSAWKMSGLNRSTTLTLFFEVNPTTQPGPYSATRQQFFLRFLTLYQHKGGEMRLRATTLTRRWAEGAASTEELVAGFDQEAAAVTMARLQSLVQT
ncbi:unnamed protein product [Sphagnum troendelagicum]